MRCRMRSCSAWSSLSAGVALDAGEDRARLARAEGVDADEAQPERGAPHAGERLRHLLGLDHVDVADEAQRHVVVVRDRSSAPGEAAAQARQPAADRRQGISMPVNRRGMGPPCGARRGGIRHRSISVSIRRCKGVDGDFPLTSGPDLRQVAPLACPRSRTPIFTAEIGTAEADFLARAKGTISMANYDNQSALRRVRSRAAR